MAADDDLNCKDCLSKLGDYLDREIDEDTIGVIDRHLDRCPPCAEEFRFEESVIRGIRRKLAEVEIPEDLRQRVVRKLNDIEGSA